jgi:hypothetical protein
VKVHTILGSNLSEEAVGTPRLFAADSKDTVGVILGNSSRSATRAVLEIGVKFT